MDDHGELCVDEAIPAQAVCGAASAAALPAHLLECAALPRPLGPGALAVSLWTGTRLEIAPAYERILADAGRSDFDALAAWPGRIVSTGSHRTTRRIEIVVRGRSIGFYLKQYRAPRCCLRYFARPGKFRRERSNLAWLREAGVATPDWVAVAERRVCGLLREALLLVRELDGSATLSDYAMHELPPVAALSRRASVAELSRSLAEPLRRAHAAGYLDRDLHWRNILLRRTGGRLDATWIDSPNGVRLPCLPMPFRAGDLADLDKHAPGVFTRSERLRFFKHYRGRRRLTMFDRWLIRRILSKNATSSWHRSTG